jgi:hypothetical protein
MKKSTSSAQSLDEEAFELSGRLLTWPRDDDDVWDPREDEDEWDEKYKGGGFWG